MRKTTVAAAIVLVALAACSDDDTSTDDTGALTTSGTATDTEASPSATSPIGTDSSGSAAATADPSATTAPGAATSAPSASEPATSGGASTAAPTSEPVVGEPVVTTELVVELDSPIGLGTRQGDDAIYVIEQGGRVMRVTASGEAAEVADISDRTEGGGEQGLLGIAFAPDGSRAFLDYTDDDGDTVVAEYPVASDGTFDVGGERVLLTIDQPYPNHNGGDLVIGADGMLYIAMGDGGSGGDPERRASDPTDLLGKLLRIDPTPSGGQAYSIPPDNPFASGSMGGIEGAPEVWSWGLRNPWKVAFDPASGELWIADVGQNAIEEINIVAPTADHPAGWATNFGWSAFEGNARYNDDVPDPGDLVFPVWTYGHDQGCSVSGGAVYRGTAIAELAPAYVYGDYCSGDLWAFDIGSGRNLDLLDGLSGLSAVRTGPDGELYVVEQAGRVSRLVQG